MSGGYTKLFSDIVDSSIWDADAEIRVVWVTLLALADEDGYVRGSVGWLASKAKVSQEMCQQAVNSFLSPDPASRTTDHEGRRIKEVERGWLILNYLYFRNEHKQLSTNPRRVYQREWMRQKRLSTKNQQESTNINTASASASVPEGESAERGGYHGIPTEAEFVSACHTAGIAQWYAKDQFLKKNAEGWGRGNWRSHVSRVKGWFEGMGRPMERPILSKNGHTKPRPNMKRI